MKKSKRVHARITEPVAEKAEKIAQNQGLNFSEFVRIAIIEKIQRDGEKLCG
jgi:antitoxin component of RelBE/YafQ-DinJ toxin-antitoxin module